MQTTHTGHSHQLPDLIRELTSPHTVRTHYVTRKGNTWYGADHTTGAPPLLWQLGNADTTSTSVEGDGVKAFGSKPVGRLEAIDLIAHIDLEAARWLADLGVDAPLDTTAAIRRLGSLAPQLDPAQVKELTRDVRRWWVQARIVTGWDSPAWQPDNSCPHCTERRTVRIRLADSIASCISCRAVWDHTSIGLLADHIRNENQTDKPPRGDNSCWSPWPLPIVINDFKFVCPKCGSPRCRWAIVARIDDVATRRNTA